MAGGLAFLPPQEIPQAFLEWKASVDFPAAVPFVDYLEVNYVLGPVRGTGRGRVNFPPSLWSVSDRTGNFPESWLSLVENLFLELGLPRTQNHAESWHNRWKNILKISHVGLYATIKHMQLEEYTQRAQISRLLNNGLVLDKR